VLAIICIPHFGHDGLCVGHGGAYDGNQVRVTQFNGEISAMRIKTVRLT
jgi:hypothetical protein